MRLVNTNLILIRRFNSGVPNFIKASSDAAFDSINRNKIVGDLKELYNEMERRKYNIRWIAGTIVVVGGYIFYGAITDWATDQAADVTSKYLENPKFKKDIISFVEQTVEELAKSPKIQNDITKLLEITVNNLADNPDIQNKLADLFTTVFKSESIRLAGGELSEDIVNQLLTSPEYETIRNEAIQFVINEMIGILNNNELQQAAGTASWNIFKSFIGVSSTDSKKIIVADKT